MCITGRTHTTSLHSSTHRNSIYHCPNAVEITASIRKSARPITGRAVTRRGPSSQSRHSSCRPHGNTRSLISPSGTSWLFPSRSYGPTRLDGPIAAPAGSFWALAAVAVFGHYRSLQVGQYPIIVNALLIGVYWLVQKRRPVAGGVLFGMALLKPQISGLFALTFLVRRQWGALAAATAYVVLASLVTWAVTRTNPIEMIEQMYTLAQGWIDHPDPRINEQHPIGISSFSSLMLALHVDRKVATPLAAITGFLLAGVLMWLWRNGRTLTLFAIAATTGRLWSYHHPYDDVTLIFLIVALGELVLTHRSRGTVFAFCLVGLSLWAPLSKNYPLALQIAQIIIWLLGLAILLAWEPRSGQIEDHVNVNEKLLSSSNSWSLAGISSAPQRARSL